MFLVWCASGAPGGGAMTPEAIVQLTDAGRRVLELERELETERRECGALRSEVHKLRNLLAIATGELERLEEWHHQGLPFGDLVSRYLGTDDADGYTSDVCAALAAIRAGV